MHVFHSTHPEPDTEPPGVPIGEPVGKGKGKGVVAQPLIQIASHVKPYSPTWRPDWRAGGEDSIYIHLSTTDCSTSTCFLFCNWRFETKAGISTEQATNRVLQFAGLLAALKNEHTSVVTVTDH